MQKTLIVFKKKHLFFGIKPEDFDRQLLMDQVWITPLEGSSAIWSFTGKQEEISGRFLHLGALFDYTPITFSYSGYIFLKKVEQKGYLGVIMDSFFTQISLTKIKGKKTDINRFTKLPPEIPAKIFQYVQQVHQRKILILDPMGFIQFYAPTFFPFDPEIEPDQNR